jgi:hypothetical protein
MIDGGEAVLELHNCRIDLALGRCAEYLHEHPHRRGER